MKLLENKYLSSQFLQMSYISIIICSRNKNLSDEYRKNIDLTIGCDYDLIVIDNSNKEYSIFEAYNYGIERSKSEILCFVHDDIRFHTINWGRKLKKLFKDNPEFSLIGVAGAQTKSKTPSGWWDCKSKDMLIHIIQDFPDGTSKYQNSGFDDHNLREAAAIDGVFMAFRKSTNVRFNSRFKGFHGYDLNLGFEVIQKGYKIGVTNQIIIQHFSLGSLNVEWLRSIKKIHETYNHLLPFKVGQGDLNEQEWLNTRRLVEQCRKNKAWSLFFYYWYRLFLQKQKPGFHIEILKKVLYA